MTSLGAVELLAHDEETLNALSGAAQAPREKLVERWQEREERDEGAGARARLAEDEARVGRRGRLGGTVDVDGVRLVTRIAGGLSIPELRNLSDTLRAKLSSGVVVVGGSAKGRPPSSRRSPRT